MRPHAKKTNGANRLTDTVLRSLAFAALMAAITSACSAASENGAFVVSDGGSEEDSAPGSAAPDASLVPDGGGSSGGSGSSGSSSGGGADSGVAPVVATSILAVHASANLYDFRLCFGAGGVILPYPPYPDDPAHPMPETNYPGVPVGGAALLPTMELPITQIVPYVIPAYYLESQGYVAGPNELTCDDLVPNILSPQHIDFFQLPPVPLPAGGGTVVLAIEGCAVGGSGIAAGSVAQCGSSFTAAGNLSAVAAPLVPSADDAGVWSVQLADLSPSFDPGDAGPALSYVDPTIDASVALSAPASSISTPPVTVPLSEAGVTSAYFVIGPSSAAPLTESLASVQYFQSPSSNPFTYFTGNATYFVAVVGDATDAAAPASLPDGAPNPAFDGHGLHVIAYPENGD